MEFVRGNEIYAELIQKLIQYLDENYDRKSKSKDKDAKSQRQLTKVCVSVVKSIHDLYPEMTKPLMAGDLSDQRGMGMARISNPEGDNENPCAEQNGVLDTTRTIDPSTGKSIGNSKSHKRGNSESKSPIAHGDSKVLAPSKMMFSGNGIIPEPRVVVIETEETSSII